MNFDFLKIPLSIFCTLILTSFLMACSRGSTEDPRELSTIQSVAVENNADTPAIEYSSHIAWQDIQRLSNRDFNCEDVLKSSPNPIQLRMDWGSYLFKIPEAEVLPRAILSQEGSPDSASLLHVGTCINAKKIYAEIFDNWDDPAYSNKRLDKFEISDELREFYRLSEQMSEINAFFENTLEALTDYASSAPSYKAAFVDECQGKTFCSAPDFMAKPTIHPLQHLPQNANKKSSPLIIWKVYIYEQNDDEILFYSYWNDKEYFRGRHKNGLRINMKIPVTDWDVLSEERSEIDIVLDRFFSNAQTIKVEGVSQRP